MTDLDSSDEVSLYNPKNIIIKDNYDKETRGIILLNKNFIDSSFYNDNLINEKILLNENRKKSISFFNSNLKIHDKNISRVIGSKRFSEKIPENFYCNFENFKNGPNVNLKQPRKSFNSKEEREFFKNLISNKQKTELCKNWVLYNDCFFKDTCSFAHGEKDLRISNTPINYKTKVCKAFAEKSFCSYGNRCHYSHFI